MYESHHRRRHRDCVLQIVLLDPRSLLVGFRGRDPLLPLVRLPSSDSGSKVFRSVRSTTDDPSSTEPRSLTLFSTTNEGSEGS